VECVRDKKTPVVTGESRQAALDLAFEITRQVQFHPRQSTLWSNGSFGL
jgi:hypothetical protein